MGDLDQATSEGYKQVIRTAYKRGVNVVDTAIVYRYMKSERDVGAVAKELGRENLIISTKGGYGGCSKNPFLGPSPQPLEGLTYSSPYPTPLPPI